ncbi:hypothetical protein [Streptomyces sp.]|uniref:hypothetical protein n=1 Tax=Streptomyces sp. TaxID=1931 RepID=UPI002D793F40|nr:hypothetical protein [Streptomyces sp.]HET6356866.1 hypothetical protein [Streptomyces sp.]
MSDTSNLNAPDPAVRAAVRELGIAPDTHGPTLNTAVSSAAVELVGRSLSEALRPYRPTAVTFWNSSDEAVLGHVVARELGAAVVRADDVEGLVALSTEIAPDARVVLLATAWTNPMRLQALVAMARVGPVEIVAVASVLASPEQAASELPTVSLLAADSLAPDAVTGAGAAGDRT